MKSYINFQDWVDLKVSHWYLEKKYSSLIVLKLTTFWSLFILNILLEKEAL